MKYITLIIAATTPEVWTTIGVWSLNIIGTLILTGLAFISRRQSKADGRIGDIEKTYITREHAEVLVANARSEAVRLVRDETAGYREDKNTIALRLDQHTQQLDTMKRAIDKVSNTQSHMAGKLDTVIAWIEAQAEAQNGGDKVRG